MFGFCAFTGFQEIACLPASGAKKKQKAVEDRNHEAISVFRLEFDPQNVEFFGYVGCRQQHNDDRNHKRGNNNFQLIDMLFDGSARAKRRFSQDALHRKILAILIPLLEDWRTSLNPFIGLQVQTGGIEWQQVSDRTVHLLNPVFRSIAPQRNSPKNQSVHGQHVFALVRIQTISNGAIAPRP
jgi:hypothetical protein